MNVKLVAGLALVLGLSGLAVAQTPLVEVDDRTIVQPFNADADTVDDWDVYNAAGVEIGDVEEVVGTDVNTPTALVVDLESKEGFADRDVVVPINQFARQEGRLILYATPEAVSAMPEWDD